MMDGMGQMLRFDVPAEVYQRYLCCPCTVRCGMLSLAVTRAGAGPGGVAKKRRTGETKEKSNAGRHSGLNSRLGVSQTMKGSDGERSK